MRYHYNRGFTLVELTSIVIIVGILSAIALPKFFDTLKFSSRTYFDEALNSIRYAQKLAIGMGCEVQVATTATSLTLAVRDSCRTGNFNTTIKDPITRQDFIKTAPANVSIASTDMPIYFDRLGRAHNSLGTITNATVSINSKNIIIVGETGFAYAP